MRGRRAQQGFTIIEVMLVLGISGMMMVGILASIGAGITGQRYKDSANSVVDYFQGQYSEVANTRNDRSLTKTCGASGVQENPSGDAYLGTTDCTIIGRMLRGDGNQIVSRPIYTTVDVLQLLEAKNDEMTLLTLAKPVEDLEVGDTYELEWGARLVQVSNSGISQKFTMGIIRSPVSGNIHTFANTSSDAVSITDLFNNPAALNSDALFCIAPDSGFRSVAAAPLGVKIAKDSASSSGVQLVGDGGGC